MAIFSTEFPISTSINRAKFLAQVVGWLQGSKTSSLLNDNTSSDLDGSFAEIKSHKTGEQLTFRELADHTDDWAIGFRYDYPDKELLWRTEGTIVRNSRHKTPLLRIKTQCLRNTPFAQPEIPKKPFLIKSIIQDLASEFDGLLEISDKPTYLKDDNRGNLELATAIIQGKATLHLPVVYISASTSSRASMTKDSILKLAYDLGGVAHVVVEPSLAFSYSLKEHSAAKNIYNGCIGIYIPHHGLQKKIFPSLSGEAQTRERIRHITLSICSQLPAKGWEWVDLQEACLKFNRLKEYNKLNHAEVESLYQEELKAKDEQIEELRLLLNSRPIVIPDDIEDGVLSADTLLKIAGPEIYEGEIFDRIRYALKTAIECANIKGVDKRSLSIFSKILESTETSQGLKELRNDLAATAKDPKKACDQMQRLLTRHGYNTKSEKNHVRMEPLPQYQGLESVTIPKTPSDNRGLKNMASDTAAALGLKGMSKI